MLTERGTELPTATIRAMPIADATWTMRQRAALAAWLAAQWQFIRPRTVPSLCAVIGMLGMIASMRALSPSREPAADDTAMIVQRAVHEQDAADARFSHDERADADVNLEAIDKLARRVDARKHMSKLQQRQQQERDMEMRDINVIAHRDLPRY